MESIAQIKSKFEAVGLFDMAVHACYKEACARRSVSFTRLMAMTAEAVFWHC